jgi:hypothetical protein
LRNQYTEPAGPKIGAARNRASIIQKALVHKRTHLSSRLILLEATAKGLINVELSSGRASSF